MKNFQLFRPLIERSPRADLLKIGAIFRKDSYPEQGQTYLQIINMYMTRYERSSLRSSWKGLSAGAPHSLSRWWFAKADGKFPPTSPSVSRRQTAGGRTTPKKELQRQELTELFASLQQTSVGETPHNNRRGNWPNAQLDEKEL